jgi:hypothetical protein
MDDVGFREQAAYIVTDVAIAIFRVNVFENSVSVFGAPF